MNCKIKNVWELIKSPKQFRLTLLNHIAPLIKDDELFLRIKWNICMNYSLNLNNPQTFNEKLQWLKLYDRKPLYTNMVDKYEAKKHVADIIGEEHIIKTLVVYNNLNEIDFESLPNQFVLKYTHDSGGVVICKDKSKLNKNAAIKTLKKSLRGNYYWRTREWPYKNVKPRIIAEEYMEDAFGELRDYKFFCFNGKVKFMFIATDRTKNTDTCFDFFDADFNHLPFVQGHPNAKKTPDKPNTFNEMKEIAERLSKGIPCLRVDLYEVNGKIYFGELTFSHFSGIVPFVPKEWDYRLGSWIMLPKVKNN